MELLMAFNQVFLNAEQENVHEAIYLRAELYYILL